MMNKNKCKDHNHGEIISEVTSRAFGISPIIAIGTIQDSICLNWYVDCKITSYFFLFFRIGVCTITTYEKYIKDWEVSDATDLKDMFPEGKPEDQKS